MLQYTFTLTEVDNWVGGDGVAKTKAMLINGKLYITDTLDKEVTNTLQQVAFQVHHALYR